MLVNPAGTGQALEIVLVEDSLLDARLTIEALKDCGIHHRLSLFRTGTEAIEFLARRGVFAQAPKPDVILLDLLLPDVEGTDLLRRFRDEEPISNTPVVILTSSDDDTDQDACERLGVSSYIRKPFNKEKFLDVIRHLKGLSIELKLEDRAEA